MTTSPCLTRCISYPIRIYNRPLRKILYYSLFVPLNFAQALFPVSLGTFNGPKRKQKECLCKIWGDKQRVLWYFRKWPIGQNDLEIALNPEICRSERACANEKCTMFQATM